MVVAELPLAGAQLRKQDPSIWGDPTVLAMDKLDPADRKKFAIPAARTRRPCRRPSWGRPAGATTHPG